MKMSYSRMEAGEIERPDKRSLWLGQRKQEGEVRGKLSQDEFTGQTGSN